MRKRVFGYLLVLVVTLAVAGCGGSGGGAGGSGAGGETEAAGGETGGGGNTEATVAGAAERVRLEMTEFEFGPADVNLDTAGTYVFVAENTGGAPHALEIEGNGLDEATETVSPGQSARLEVELKPGKYRIYCPVGNHEALGMVGTVTVG